jgi:hypothetical protein
MPFILTIAVHFIFIPHNLVLHKPSAFGLPGDYVNLFRSYVTSNLMSTFLEFCLRLSTYNPVYLNDLSSDPCCSLCLIMIYMMQFTALGDHNDIKIHRGIKSPKD